MIVQDVIHIDAPPEVVCQAQALATGFCVYTVSQDFKTMYEERILERAADFRLLLERYYQEQVQGVLPSTLTC